LGLRRERTRRLFVVDAIAQLDEHRLVLLLHEPLDDGREIARPQMLGVRRLARRNDATAIGEQVRDHMGVIDARVFSLNVIQLALVSDVGVVSN
jgi:hypothetical protein